MIILLLIWVVLMIIGMFTDSVHALFTRGQVNFSFRSHPDHVDLFRMYPIESISKFETSGHFIMFFILTALLIAVCKDWLFAILVAFSFAITSELIQPFFGRGGDLYDLGADSIGILLAFIYQYIAVKVEKYGSDVLEN